MACASKLLRCAVLAPSLYAHTISSSAFRAPCTLSRSATYSVFPFCINRKKSAAILADFIQ